MVSSSSTSVQNLKTYTWVKASYVDIALVEEALKRSQTEDDGEINRWLLQTFS